ncbi:siderophore-iron reductase FhuF [Methylobacterium sp. E-045]|uniref:siderophore-iron reductase FhuF n=1 Tax=Methylobacterium sp. E-045 TaxID=2836575 RepID=UPI001FB91422|nr:siderophore-iron reductase FhuF [Methylobacterium sp. E-045]MCJ2127614.1 siderophore-iron reductase FhuF [Methylobacterium sp. E-045]
MIDQLAGLVPPSLSAFGSRIATAPSRSEARPLSILTSKARFDEVVDGFGRSLHTASDNGFETADRRALVSLWTQYYLPALIIPYFTALSRLGRALPIGFDRIGFELDESGIVSRFIVAEEDDRHGGAEPGLDPLIEGHLRPFFDLCQTHYGLSRHVLWCNAGVTADFALRELSRDAVPAFTRAEACLGRCGSDAFGRCPLAQAFRGGEERRRRVCCMRYRIPGVPSCGALCPVDHLAKAPC